MLDKYLPLGDIAAGTGTPLTTLRRIAKRDRWPSVAEHTGRRGRPRLRYRLAEALASLHIAA